jgi:hypothetical protein
VQPDQRHLDGETLDGPIFDRGAKACHLGLELGHPLLERGCIDPCVAILGLLR